MSMQNENYLEKIRRLEQELRDQKERYRIMSNNYDMVTHQLSLSTQELYFVYSCLDKRQVNMLTKAWLASDTRKSVVNKFLNTTETQQEACEDVFSTKDGDCIDILNHERDELFREG